ncbi:MAG: glycosyltransferase [DPANN group archaeon]|nr:glycosyltransferase [DPANN group archaeon]
MMLSIIIPTYNETRYVGKLLQSLCNQTYKDFEVIIADANSKDNTEKVVNSFAEKLRLRFIRQAGKGVANARNCGAKIASGDLLLFLDADVVLKNYFLEFALREFEKRALNAASVYMRPIEGEFGLFGRKRAWDRLVWQIFFNTVIGVSQYIYPGAIGICIFCKKNIHNKIGGFDETIKIGEDFEYIGRASKIGKFRVMYRSIFVSVRRAEMEGRLRNLLKYVLVTIHKIFFGEIRTDFFKYKFGQHK